MEEALIKRVMPHSIEAVSYTHLSNVERKENALCD